MIAHFLILLIPSYNLCFSCFAILISKLVSEFSVILVSNMPSENTISNIREIYFTTEIFKEKTSLFHSKGEIYLRR